MLELQCIISPLIGGAIGYVTNDIAIRMLFRPHRAKHIFGVQLPFTPGIIPKEKGRIAETIGTAISDNLMSKEVLERYLLSDEMVAKVRNAAQEFVDKQKVNGETLRQFLMHYVSACDIDSIAKNVNDSITRQAHEKITDPAIGRQVAHAALDCINDKINASGAQEVLDALGVLSGLKGAIAMLFGKDVIAKFLALLREPAEKFLASNINSMLQKNGDAIISKVVGNQTEDVLSKPVKVLLEGKDEQLDELVNTVASLYQTVITDHLPKILESIDISRIVRDRINEMDMDETEKLILQVLNKELRAIVWLGALLGMIMGCVNILFH